MKLRLAILLVPAACYSLAASPLRKPRVSGVMMVQWRSGNVDGKDPYGGHAHEAFNEDAIAHDSDLVFHILDKDDSGGVSKDELIAHLSRAGYDAGEVSTWFDMDLDKNSDGQISKEELRSAFLSYPELRTAPGLGGGLGDEIPQKIRMDATNFIAAADTGRQGFITSQELEAHMSKRGFNKQSVAHVFAQLDLDGTLSRDEIAEVFLKYSALRLALREA